MVVIEITSFSVQVRVCVVLDDENGVLKIKGDYEGMSRAGALWYPVVTWFTCK